MITRSGSLAIAVILCWASAHAEQPPHQDPTPDMLKEFGPLEDVSVIKQRQARRLRVAGMSETGRADDGRSVDLTIDFSPPERHAADEELTLRATVTPQAEVAEVTLFVRGERDAVYTGYVMRPSKDGSHEAVLGPESFTGQQLRLYVQANPHRGPLPSTAGGPDDPFLIQLDQPASGPLNAALLGSVALVVIVWRMKVSSTARREWRRSELAEKLAANRQARAAAEAAIHQKGGVGRPQTPEPARATRAQEQRQ